MEDVLFVGISTLDDASQMAFVRHCIDQNNWAYQGKKRKVVENAIMGGEAPTISSSSAASSSMSASAMMAATVSSSSVPGVSGSFRVLVPGVDGARGNDALSEQSFVITGTFPEAGGVDAGVGNVKAMIESFGGSVITRFSKKTSECVLMCAITGHITCYLSR
jgi:NAD-dependent DNA ligase